jgi:hypothetical protein
MREVPNNVPEKAPDKEVVEMPPRVKVADVVDVAVSSEVYSQGVLAVYPGYELFDPDKHDVTGVERREDRMGGGALPNWGYTIVKVED